MTRQYKALITDFDNSLVGPDAQVPEIVIEPLRALRKAGVLVTIATGRGYYGRIKEAVNKYPDIFDTPVVVYGGAEIVDPSTETVKWSEYIHRPDFEKVFEYFLSQNVNFIAEIGPNMYASNGPKRITSWHDPLDVKGLADLKQDFVAKILVSATLEQLTLEKATELEDYIARNFPQLHITKITNKGAFGVDITGKTSKHVGVLELLKHLDLHPDEVVAMGDSYNDYPLLTAVGTKVAMADAPQELKAIADFIAPTQSENGILAVIDKYFTL